MAFVDKRVGTKELFSFYPLLKLSKAEEFDDSNFQEVCDRLASDFVRISDRLGEPNLSSEYSSNSLPPLSQEGLDSVEITNCIDNLRENFERQTVIPFVCRINSGQESASIQYATIGFNHQLPREWFLPKEKQKMVFSNDFMFQDYGRDIALEERRYLQESILKNEKIPNVKTDFTPGNVLHVVEEMVARGPSPEL